MREEGLRLAQATRGDVFRVLSNSDFAFQRLALELSGYYLLGFEPEAGDRDGRPHDIAVAVRRDGVTVRSRRQFTIEPRAVRTAQRRSSPRCAIRCPPPRFRSSSRPTRSAIRTTTSCGCSSRRISIARSIRRGSSPPATSSSTSTASSPPVRWTRRCRQRAARRADPALLQHRARRPRQVHDQARGRGRCRGGGASRCSSTRI